MSVHISAKKGEIAPTLLMPGDPLRAKYIAENFLQEVKLLSDTRNIFFYTGTYKNKEISVGASGMGIPSIGIYSYELYTQYDVQTIIRIGTCGSYTTDLKVFDMLNVKNAASESTYARFSWENDAELIEHQGGVFDLINETAHQLDLPILPTTIHTSDIFYRKDTTVPAIVQKYNCKAVEMEAFGLFANAQFLGKSAAAILTVSDVIPTGDQISADERETALKQMIHLSLETAIQL